MYLISDVYNDSMGNICRSHALNSESSVADVPNDGATDSFSVTFKEGETEISDSSNVTIFAATGEGKPDATTTAGSDYKFKATAKEGYQIDSVVATIVVPAAEEGGETTTKNETLTAADGVYTIADSIITGAITVVITTSEVTPEITKHKVTIANNDTTNVTAVKYAVGDDTNFTDFPAEGVDVEEGKVFKFQFTLNEGFDVSVKAGETPLQAENNIYSVKIDADTNISISATQKKTEYKVTVTYPTEDVDFNYNAECVTIPEDAAEGTKNGTIAVGKDLSFKVTLKEGKDKKISVAYTVGSDSEATPLAADEDGNYVINAEKITDDISITVTAENWKEYTITFDYDEKVEKATVTEEKAGENGDPKSTTTSDTNKAVKVSEKNAVSFAVTLKDAETTKYMIAKVTRTDAAAEGETAEEVKLENENGIYSLGKLTADTTIKIETELDPDKCNKLIFSTDKYKGYTATIAGVEGTWTVDSNPYLTETDGDVTVTIQANEGYQITKVEANGKELAPIGETPTPSEPETPSESESESESVSEPSSSTESESESESTPANSEGTADLADEEQASYDLAADTEGEEEPKEEEPVRTSGSYKVTLGGENREVTLKVYTEPKAVTEENTIYVSNKSVNMTYVLAGDSKIEEAGANTYKVNPGAKTVEFTITSTNAAYAPKITYTDAGGAVQTAATEKTGNTNKKGQTPYKCCIEASMLPGRAIITIDQQEVEKQISVQYDLTEVELTAARIDASAVAEDKKTDPISVNDPDNANLVEVTYTVPYGKTLIVTVEALENCSITKAATTIGEAAPKNEKIKPAGFELSVKATDADRTVTVITSESKYSPNALVDVKSNEVLEPVKNAYDVDYDGKYAVSAVYGSDLNTKVVLSKVEVLQGKTKLGEKDGALIEGYIVANANNTEYTIDLSKEEVGKQANKTLTVNLYVDGVDKAVASYTLKVRPTMKSVAVTGVKKGALTQTIDTQKKYAITPNPKTADISGLTVNVKPAEGTADADVQAVIANGELVITTGQNTGKEATVEIVNGTKKDSEGKDVDNVVCSFKVTTAAQIKSTVAPTVALQSSDDTTLTLTLGSKGLETPEKGEVFYKIDIEPQSAQEGAAEPSFDPDNVRKSIYIPRDGVSQTAELKVINAVRGSGKEWAFDVTVQLVQTAGKDSTSQVIGDASKKFEAKDKKAFKTKNPYYETKLKLKKGTTTIYTNQKNVAFATPLFNKNTTYTAIDDYKITDKSYTGRKALTFSVSDGKLYASATQDTWIGKHTIEVTAETAYQTYASSATIVVTVVKGIDSITLTAPSTDIYKQANKAASMKITPVYNNGGTAPKAKKVTWDIETSEYLEGMVTVKNGTVSVNKNVVVSNTTEDNQFTVIATAADYTRSEEDNNVRTAEMTFTITDKAMEMGNVVIATQSGYGEEAIYTVVAKAGDTVKAAEINGAKVYALKPGAAVNGTFKSDDKLDTANLTFKSSNNKALTIAADGEINVLKPAKKITITATANDGSKKKSTMKFDVEYEETGELGVLIASEDMPDGYVPESGVHTFKGTPNKEFSLQIVRKGENDWEPISDYTNFKVDVKNAKVMGSEAGASGNAKEIMYIVANKATAEIVITDNTKKNTKYTYKITNEAFSSAKAPKVSVSGTLLAGWCEAPQEVVLKLDKRLAADNKFVKVEPDYTAINERNGDGYWELADALSLYDGWLEMDDEGRVVLRTEGSTNIPAGSYKLKVTVGEIEKDGMNFIPDSQSATVTVKAVAPQSKKGSFKVTTKYTISAKDGGKAVLTGTGKLVNSVHFINLLNENVNGTKNNFTEYFELKNNILSIKPGKLDDLIELRDAKNLKDFSGYVSYSASFGSGAASDYKNDTVKITVTLKDDAVVKYAATNATIFKGDTTKADISITANRQPQTIAYAYAPTNEGNFTVENVNGSSITFSSADCEARSKAYSVEFYVVPSGSYFENEFATVADKDKDELFKTKGIKLTAKITVKAKDVSGKIKVDKKQLKQVFKNTDYINDHADDRFANYFIQVPYTKNVACEISEITTTDPLITFGFHTDEDDGKNYIDIYVAKSALNSENYGKVLDKVTATIKFTNGGADEKVDFQLTLPKKAATDYNTVVHNVQENLEKIQDAVIPYAGWSEEDIAGMLLEKIYDECELTSMEDSSVGIKCDAEDVTITAAADNTPGEVAVNVKITDENTVKDGEATESTTITFKLSIPTNPVELTSKVQTLIDNIETGIANSSDREDETKVAAYFKENIELPSHLRLMIEYFDAKSATDIAGGKVSFDVYVYDIKYGYEYLYKGVELTTERLATIDETADAITAKLASEDCKVFNNTTQDELTEIINEVITNKDVTMEWIEEPELTAAEVPAEGKEGKGTWKGKIKLSNPKSVTETKEKELEVTFNIDPLLNESGIVSKVKAAVGCGDSTPDINVVAKLAKSNNFDTVKAAVLKAANDAVKGNESYQVVYKKNADQEIFGFVPVEYNKDGSIYFTLEIQKKGEDGNWAAITADADVKVGGSGEGEAITLAADPTLETLAEAAAEVKAAFPTDGENPYTVTNETTASSIATAANAAITENSGITATVTDKDFVLKKATIKEKGSLTVTIILTKGEETLPVELTFEIAILDQTTDEAKAAAKAAAEAVTVSNADAEGEANTNKQNEIVTAAQNAVADKYTITVVEGKELKVQAATLNADGNATITLKIGYAVADDSNTEITDPEIACEITIASLDQTLDEAEAAVTKKLSELTIKKSEIASAKTTIVDAVSAVDIIKTSKYTIAWAKKEASEGGTSEDDYTVSADSTTITGNLIITVQDSDPEVTKTIAVNLTVTDDTEASGTETAPEVITTASGN